jgi:hypothetical protein
MNGDRADAKSSHHAGPCERNARRRVDCWANVSLRETIVTPIDAERKRRDASRVCFDSKNRATLQNHAWSCSAELERVVSCQSDDPMP